MSDYAMSRPDAEIFCREQEPNYGHVIRVEEESEHLWLETGLHRRKMAEIWIQGLPDLNLPVSKLNHPSNGKPSQRWKMVIKV